MNPNYLKYKKQQVKYWSEISALILASLPLIYQLVNKNAWEGELIQTSNIMVLFILLAITVITYYTSYYTLSSLFWPEPLSIFNHLLLIPCTLWTGISLWDRGKLWLEK